MTENEALEKFEALAKKHYSSFWNGPNPEGMHAEADDLLCEVLTFLGYKCLVEKFNSITRWYA